MFAELAGYVTAIVCYDRDDGYLVDLRSQGCYANVLTNTTLNANTIPS